MPLNKETKPNQIITNYNNDKEPFFFLSLKCVAIIQIAFWRYLLRKKRKINHKNKNNFDAFFFQWFLLIIWCYKIYIMCIHACMHIYIYIYTHRQTVSLYHKSSVWLDT